MKWKVFKSKTFSSHWKSSLDGLASSHLSWLTLSGTPKILLYCMEYRWHMTHGILSIESSDVGVWLVWILTTKCKSLKRVETCQKRAFHFISGCYVNPFFRFNLPKSFYSLHVYMYPLICSTLNPWLFICIWMMLLLSRTLKDTRLSLADCTHNPYSFCLLKCAIIPLGLYWPAIAMIISSCLVSSCYQVN
jgi:hypothetical protein